MSEKVVNTKEPTKPTLLNVTIDGLGKVLFLVTGFVSGNMVGKLIDDNIVKYSGSGLDNGRALVSPLVLIAGGLAGSAMIKKENLRFLFYGVGTAGGYRGVRIFLDKSILNGFAGIGIPDKTENENIDDAVKAIKLNVERLDEGSQDLGELKLDHLLDLPDLKGTTIENRLNGDEDDFIDTFNGEDGEDGLIENRLNGDEYSELLFGNVKELQEDEENLYGELGNFELTEQGEINIAPIS